MTGAKSGGQKIRGKEKERGGRISSDMAHRNRMEVNKGLEVGRTSLKDFIA